jgi:hypothetical protein
MPTLQQAIAWTVAYADVFDFPLNFGEIQRYLWGISAARSDVAAALRPGALWPYSLSHIPAAGDPPAGGYYTLPGRESLVGLRARRERVAAPLWDKAQHWSRRMASLPFVRMVALTGSLAVGNVEPGADIDYLIVTAPGRLWVCRAGVIALTVWAAQRGDILCPNYFVSENALSIRERNPYTAREFAQMVPMRGLDVYRRMCACNAWVRDYLPNAQGVPDLSARVCPGGREPRGRPLPQTFAEAMLRARPGAWLEAWEMRRKLRKFSPQRENHPESGFGPDWCKGHFNDHMTRTMQAFAGRLRQLGADGGWIGEVSPDVSVEEAIAA